MKSLVEYILENIQEEVNGFCILKPEFLEHEEEFEKLLMNNKWSIIQKVKRTLSKPEAEELYIGMNDKDFYDDLCTYMASDDSISYLCHKDCKNPIEDMKKLKDKVRKSWGKDEMKNAMHSSDSKENVEREYKLILQNKSI